LTLEATFDKGLGESALLKSEMIESPTEKEGEPPVKVLATQFLPKTEEQDDEAEVGAKIFPGDEALT